jgi:hypothetical protein
MPEKEHATTCTRARTWVNAVILAEHGKQGRAKSNERAKDLQTQTQPDAPIAC